MDEKKRTVEFDDKEQEEEQLTEQDLKNSNPLLAGKKWWEIASMLGMFRATPSGSKDRTKARRPKKDWRAKKRKKRLIAKTSKKVNRNR